MYKLAIRIVKKLCREPENIYQANITAASVDVACPKKARNYKKPVQE
jgi:hypothetical protein